MPRFLELLAITGFAFCQPLLEVFSRTPQTFVAEGASTRDVVGFALAVTLLPAAVLFGVGLLSRPFGPRARRVVHVLSIGVVTGAFVVQAVVAEWSWKGFTVWAAALSAAVLAALAAWRLDLFRTFLRFAAVAPLVFAALFLTTSPVADIVWASPPALPPGEAPDVPILFIVLDELPTASMLDADGNIDATLLPNLAALAGDATWYRNHTTVAGRTEEAVPAIVTGQRPTGNGVAPIASVHDESLFTWLGRSYEMNVVEPLTDICPASVCGNNDGFYRGGLRELLRQGRDTWLDRARGGDQQVPPAFALGNIRTARVGLYERFRAGYRPDGSRRLDFVHIVLPHSPFLLTPTGTVYSDKPDGWLFEAWLDDEAARIGYQRHLQQLQYTDRLVGHLLDRIRRLGHYDETMIVLTGDHGISFGAGLPPRLVTQENLPDIAWTALMVKAPGQTRGSIDERPAEVIDILPTLADHLGVELPWRPDGRSLLGPASDDDDRRLLVPDEDFVQQVDEITPLGAVGELLLEPGEDGFVPVGGEDGYRRMLAHGPAAPGRGPLRLFRTGEFGGLVGARAGPLIADGEARIRGVVEDPVRDVEEDVRRLPLYVRARVDTDEPVPVALVVNDRVAGWTRTHRDLETNAWFVIPETLLRPGRNELSLHVIDGDPGRPVLRPVRSD